MLEWSWLWRHWGTLEREPMVPAVGGHGWEPAHSTWCPRASKQGAPEACRRANTATGTEEPSECLRPPPLPGPGLERARAREEGIFLCTNGLLAASEDTQNFPMKRPARGE